MPPKRNLRGIGGDEQGDDAPGGGGRGSAKKSSKKRAAAPRAHGGGGVGLAGKSAGEADSASAGVDGGLLSASVAVQGTKWKGKAEAIADGNAGVAGGLSLGPAAVPGTKGQGKKQAVEDGLAGHAGGLSLGPAAVPGTKGKGKKQAVEDGLAGHAGDVPRGSGALPPKNDSTKGKTARMAEAKASPSGKRQLNKKYKNSGQTTGGAGSGYRQANKRGKKSLPVPGTSAVGSPNKDSPKGKAAVNNIRKNKKAKKGIRGSIEDPPTEDEEQFLLADEQSDEGDWMQAMPKKQKTVRKAARRLEKKVLRQQKVREENETFKQMDEDSLAEYLLDRLISETILLYVYNEISIAYIASGCRAPGPPKDQDKPSKKTGKKSSRQGGGGDFWDKPATETDVKDPVAVASKLFEEYESSVNHFTYSTASQPIVNEHPVFDMIHITTIPSPDDVERFSQESLDLYLRIKTFSVTVMINGITIVVPVTKATPFSIEQTTYHVVVMTRPTDMAQVHLLIEQFDNYIGAFKVVLEHEDPNDKYWIILGLKNKLPSFFEKVLHIRCNEGYKHLKDVVLHEETFSEVFGFYFSFNIYGLKPEDKHVTARELVLLDTSFVVICEILRLRVVKEWTKDGVTCSRQNKLKIPVAFDKLVKDWSNLSKLIFQLYLAILEEPLLEALPDDDSKVASPYYTTMTDAREMWRTRNKLLEAITFFFEDEEDDENVKLEMEWLCGQHVTLLRHDRDSCHKVLMRRLGYLGGWISKFRPPFEKGDASSVQGILIKEGDNRSVKDGNIKDGCEADGTVKEQDACNADDICKEDGSFKENEEKHSVKEEADGSVKEQDVWNADDICKEDGSFKEENEEKHSVKDRDSGEVSDSLYEDEEEYAEVGPQEDLSDEETSDSGDDFWNSLYEDVEVSDEEVTDEEDVEASDEEVTDEEV